MKKTQEKIQLLELHIVESLVKKDKEYFDCFDAVVVDESHKAKSASIKTILEKCENASRNFGLSGTIPKPGTLDRLTIMAYTGPVITSIRADYLIEQGHITPCEVYVIEMDYAREEVKDGFRTLFNRTEEDRKKLLNLEQNYVIQSEERLDFITDMILKNKKNALVLFYRIEYGNKIYDALRKKTDRKIMYIDGGTDKDLRSYQKDNLEDSKITHYVDIEFGNDKIRFDENDEIILSNGNVKSAKDITFDDDIDDNFIYSKIKK
jgi:superfamily II DNA or RNA helicase